MHILTNSIGCSLGLLLIVHALRSLATGELRFMRRKLTLRDEWVLHFTRDAQPLGYWLLFGVFFAAGAAVLVHFIKAWASGAAG